ncbi:unnamed protein product [Rhizophagus irregularis]|nr:unnamed protein product [Rhizophagus irregularis]
MEMIMRTNSPSESYLTTPISEDIQSSSTKKSKSKAVNPPAGKFVPLRSGKTNLSYEFLNKQESNSWKTVRDEKHDNFPGLVGINETILAVIGCTIIYNSSGFSRFVAPVRKYVSHLRFIRDSAPKQVYSSNEPEICHVVYIKSIEFKSISTPPYAFPFLHDPFLPSSEVDSISSTQGVKIQQTTSPLHELPTCPVCLERMDASVTGLLTILCQHTFHCDCLSKWGDSSCPVCRYSQKLCGNIGCGRYQEAHAYHHYKETFHLYALELETQRVWDYAGDGYVHRLIQNKTDGKLIRINLTPLD